MPGGRHFGACVFTGARPATMGVGISEVGGCLRVELSVDRSTQDARFIPSFCLSRAADGRGAESRSIARISRIRHDTACHLLPVGLRVRPGLTGQRSLERQPFQPRKHLTPQWQGCSGHGMVLVFPILSAIAASAHRSSEQGRRGFFATRAARCLVCPDMRRRHGSLGDNLS